MDTSKEFYFMLNQAASVERDTFRNFDRTKNLQDQLQEMVNENGILNMFHSFMEWFNSDEEYEQLPMDSMEQLWLAFVMKEKHSKTWNGKEWT